MISVHRSLVFTGDTCRSWSGAQSYRRDTESPTLRLRLADLAAVATPHRKLYRADGYIFAARDGNRDTISCRASAFFSSAAFDRWARGRPGPPCPFRREKCGWKNTSPATPAPD